MTFVQKNQELDAVVVGAGFSGLYMLHRLREAGFSVRVFEAGGDVGGTWYWNRYPGARCDSDSIYYNYTFSEELYKEWTWSTRFAGQKEILSYLSYVADKFDLRRDIQFKSRVTAAHFDGENNRWLIQTNDGKSVFAKYFIPAVGNLSAANIPKIKGLDRFGGECYHTGHWPHEKVVFKGKRVGVIGTGSTGIQTIPVIAQEAEHLTVFQRTPQYSAPARNHIYDQESIQQIKEKYNEIKNQIRNSDSGLPYVKRSRSALEDTPEERQRVYEEAWQKGGMVMSSTYSDLSINPAANETVAEFYRTKIRDIVKDSEVAEKLMPTYYYGTKRPTLNTDYFETFNRDNVTLVDVQNETIEEVTAKGLRTKEAEYELDILVFATGYDAVTGTLFKMDIRGKEGLTLKEKWAGGAKTSTYLGLTTTGFPNMFIIAGPESPSVVTNQPIALEHHVEWIGDCLEFLRANNLETIEPMVEGEESWSKHCNDIANYTLFTKTESWYTGANIEDKPSGFPIYLGGFTRYTKVCDEAAAKGYEGFSLIPVRKTVL